MPSALPCSCALKALQARISCHMAAAHVGKFVCAGDSRRPKRYFPFAEGPRSCVGQSLAKVSLVATMATLLSRFSFKLAEEVRQL